MGVVLVVEPESSQAEQLKRVLRKRVHAELLLVSSTAAAIETMDRGIPDLILVSALLSPRDEDRLMAHLRSLEGAAHLQTLTIPQLSMGSRGAEEQTVLGRFRKKKAATPTRGGCDPKVFAEEISVQLARALEIRQQPQTEPLFRPSVVEPIADPIYRQPAAEPAAFASSASSAAEPEAEPDFTSAILNSTRVDQDVEPDFTAAILRSAAAEPDIEPDFTAAILRSASAEAEVQPDYSSVIFKSADVEPEVEPAYTSTIFKSAPAEPDVEPQFTSGVFESGVFESGVLESGVFESAIPESGAAASGGFESVIVEPSVQPYTRPDVFESRDEPDFMFAKLESAIKESGIFKSAFDKPEPVARPAARSHEEPDLMSALMESAIFTSSLEQPKPAAVESKIVAFRSPAVLPPVELVEPVLPPVVEAQAVPEPEVVEPPPVVKAAVEPEDLLERLARRFGFGSEMFKVADANAPSALHAGNTRHQPEPVVRSVVETVPQAQEPVVTSALKEPEPEAPRQDDAADRLAAQVAAVQAEAEATLAAELERVRAEGEARRLAELARLQAESDVMRDAAIAEARAAAEREAREALASELTRVRSEAEGVFAADLARVRAEVEEKLSAQVGAAETRLAAAEVARSAAEAEAAAELRAEVARVRGEAEARVQSELERIRQEAEAARVADQSVAKHATEQIRETAAREARTIAEQAARRTLETEIARVRAQADTFLDAEVSRVRAEAQERQAVELQDLRAQMAEIRETAARTAAEQSGDYYKIWKPRLVAQEASPPVAEEQPEEDGEPTLIAKYLPWVKWVVPTAACFLLLINTGMASFSAPKKAAPPVHAVEPVEPPVVEKVAGALKVDSTPAGAELTIDGRKYGKSPITISDLSPGVHTLVLRTRSGSVTRRVTIRAGQTTLASEAIYSGWLAIFSPIPVSVSLNGKRASAAEDGRIMTAPGSYKVDLVNERFNYHVTERLEVKPGEITAHTVMIPKATVRVTAPAGAEVRVDGQSAGRAPLADISIPIGTHEVTAVHPTLGARTATVTVRSGEVTEAKLEF